MPIPSPSSRRAASGQGRRELTFVESTPKGLFLRLKITPRAPKNSVEGVEGGITPVGGYARVGGNTPPGDALKVRITAPPVEGEANRELISFLAGFLGVKKSALSIEAGEKSRIKRVRVDGMTRAGLEELLGAKLSGSGRGA